MSKVFLLFYLSILSLPALADIEGSNYLSSDYYIALVGLTSSRHIINQENKTNGTFTYSFGADFGRQLCQYDGGGGVPGSGAIVWSFDFSLETLIRQFRFVNPETKLYEQNVLYGAGFRMNFPILLIIQGSYPVILPIPINLRAGWAYHQFVNHSNKNEFGPYVGTGIEVNGRITDVYADYKWYMIEGSQNRFESIELGMRFFF